MLAKNVIDIWLTPRIRNNKFDRISLKPFVSLYEGSMYVVCIYYVCTYIHTDRSITANVCVRGIRLTAVKR